MCVGDNHVLQNFSLLQDHVIVQFTFIEVLGVQLIMCTLVNTLLFEFQNLH